MSLRALMQQFSQPISVEEFFGALASELEQSDPLVGQYTDFCCLCCMLEWRKAEGVVQLRPEYRTEGQGA